MMRLVLLIVALSVAVGIVAAFAQQRMPMPMLPYSHPAAPMTELGGPMIPGNIGGGSGPPPTCSNSLDFTQACNSQYITVI